MELNTLAVKENREKEFNLGTFIFLFILIGFITYIGSIMGVGPMFKTILNTAYSVLLETVLYICAICVIMGAVSALLTEFGVVGLTQWLINPIMKPIYNMPGAASLGIVTTFLSDNPAILALAQEKKTRKYFKKYQTPALCNLGTAFGMGMIVCTFMLGLGVEFIPSIIAGLFGCFIGSIVTTRLMQFFTKRYYVKKGLWEEMQEMEDVSQLTGTAEEDNVECKEKKGLFSRVMDCLLEGGKQGWKICYATTPGVVCICTLVMLLTFGPGTAADGSPLYTGAAYEGIQVLPKLGDLISPITQVLFGFQDGSNIVVPITSLGAVGAAIGMIPQMVANGLAGANEIAVFTSIGMCWSGYLSTHISMMDALGRRELIPSALIAHTIAGLVAGIVAHYFFLIIT
ncbi:MAG: hypothetical protein ACK5MV_03300 [Aminipila sp.]